MVLTFIKNAARRLAWPGRRRVAHKEVLAQEGFRVAIERERARAERGHCLLAMIEFTPRASETRQESIAQLVSILSQRLRITDVIGFLPHDGLAALLPGARPSDAWQVADEICGRFPEELPPPICMVYAFPSHMSSDGDGHGSNGNSVVAVEGRPVELREAMPLRALFMRQMPWWKRMMDIIGAIMLLVALGPLLALAAALIKLLSPGPILFCQWRMGQGGQPFLMYKFRTMVRDADRRQAVLRCLNERDGPAFKIKNDPRVTGIGRFLRATCIDELPQLWNVLLGQMSLVGPRPLPCDESVRCTLWQQRRLDVSPGLTCTWQVEKQRHMPFDEWARLDIAYVRTLGFWVDICLLLRTMPAVLLRRGAD